MISLTTFIICLMVCMVISWVIESLGYLLRVWLNEFLSGELAYRLSVVFWFVCHFGLLIGVCYLAKWLDS